jgi:MinD-like ATPase involved in chromosome partitioning or flagellar assembly
LNAADTLVLVMTPDVASVQTTSATLRAINGLGHVADRTLIVLNQVSPQRALPQAAIEKAIARTITTVVPFDENQTSAMSQGMPLSASQPASTLAKAVSDLTNVIFDQLKMPGRLAQITTTCARNCAARDA